MKALEAAGITVAERVPLVFPATRYDAGYLRAKKDSGHIL